MSPEWPTGFPSDHHLIVAAFNLTRKAPKEKWYEVLSQLPGPTVTDAAVCRKIEQSGQPWKVRDRATGIEMVLVMPGEFLMGSPESERGRNADEGPQHRVRLTQAFYLGVTEVTQAQWQHLMGPTSSFFEDDSKPVDPTYDEAADGSATLHRVFSIGEDRDGKIWFGTSGQDTGARRLEIRRRVAEEFHGRRRSDQQGH